MAIDHRDDSMNQNHYRHLLVMIGLSFMPMYVLMSAMVKLMSAMVKRAHSRCPGWACDSH